MPRQLDVYLHRDLVGHLTQDDEGRTRFSYTETCRDNPQARPLSQSLPLRPERFTQAECRGFFGGILPEQGQREMVARNLGISARNDFAMLEAIGGECAGAVTFMPEGERLPERNDRYRDLRDEEFAQILKTLPRRPLLAGDQDVRLSLAGAQGKIAVRVRDNQISIPLGGAPSTHILKPQHDRFPGLVTNEVFCLGLVNAAGITGARAEARRIESIEYALIERYDRRTVESATTRLHQEDFCQALGVASDQKYQNEGGPSLQKCFELVRRVSSAPVIDLGQLLDAVIFNYLIGNHDAHGKNFSLVYGSDPGETRLAPLYDLVSTIYYPELSPKMAMKIGGEYRLDRIGPRHFETLAEEAALARPLVRQRVREVAARVLEALNVVDIEGAVAEAVATIVRERCDRTMSEFGK